MNIAKKLLFGLLLGGALFATACGDSGEKVAKGGTCTAEKKCDTDLVCDADATDNTKGTCKEKYDQTKCTNGAEEPAKALKDQQSDGKYCKPNASSSQPQGAQVGTECTAQTDCEVAGSAQGLKCVKVEASDQKKTCQLGCTGDNDDDSACKAADTNKPKCKAANDPSTIFICKA